MALQSITLTRAAEVFRVHPRTILRAIAGQHNTYWSEDINNDKLSIDDIADAYGTSARTLRAVIEDRDELMTPDEAAEKLGVAPRTFRDRLIAGRYKKIGSGGIARYLGSEIINDAIATSTE